MTEPAAALPLVLHAVSSPNVRKVGIMLEELGVDYRLRPVSVYRGEQFTPEFLALNPQAKLPVLTDPNRGVTIFESGAILIYLAETYGAFLPAGGAARYDVLQWLMAQMAGIGPMLGQHNHFHLLLDDAGSYAGARYREQARRFYRLLDDRLERHEWIAGGAYSIADMAIYPWSLYLKVHGFAESEHPALMRWRSVIRARPAVTRSWQRFSADLGDWEKAEKQAASAVDLDAFFARDPAAPPADYSRSRA